MILSLYKKKDREGNRINGYKKLAKVFGLHSSRIKQIVLAEDR